MNIITRVTGLLTGTAISVAVSLAVTSTPAQSFEYRETAALDASQVQVAERYRPCTTEDDIGPCFWNAQEQGNGKGRSFWVEADGSITYEDEAVVSTLLSSTRLTRIPKSMVSVAMDETGLPRRLAKRCKWVDLKGTTYVLCPRGRWFSS